MIRTALIVATILVFLYVIYPFVAPIGMAAIFAVLFYPWMKRIEFKKFPNSLAAALFTLAVTLLLFLPVSVLIVAGAKTGLNHLKQLRRASAQAARTGVAPEATADHALDKIFEGLGIEKLLQETAKIAPINPDEVSGQIKDYVESLASKLIDALSGFVAQVPTMMIAFAVFLFSLYYFLADGPKIVQGILSHSFFTPTETVRLLKTFSGLCRSVILASVASGGAQAVLAAIVSASIGIKQFHMVFLVVFVSSFVPMIGAFPIVISLALFQFFTGHPTPGIVMGIAAVFIGVIDNFIRPLVLKGGGDLHPLLGFVSALGGLATFGVTGIFLGPVISGVAVEMAKVLHQENTRPSL
jgi:predicted PurR-regulated permease PerM